MNRFILLITALILLVSANSVYADRRLTTDTLITTTYGYAIYPTGTLGYDPRVANVGNQYMFLAGVANCGARSVVVIDHDGTSTHAAVLLTEVLAAKGRSIAVSQATCGAGSYGWFQIAGKTSLYTAASDAADVIQYACSVAGAIDDTGVVPIIGLHLAAATSGTGTAYISYPTSQLANPDLPLSDAAVTTVDGYDAYGTGRIGYDASGYKYVYLEGVASCAARSVVAIDHDGTTTTSAVLLTETEAAKGRSLAVAVSAATDTNYGWFMVQGLASIAVLASDAADAEQLATTTAAYLDDAGTTPIHGLILVAATSGTGTAYVIYPHTGN